MNRRNLRNHPQKKDGVCNKSDDSDDSTKIKTTKHVYTEEEEKTFLSPEELDELKIEPTTNSAKYRRTKIHNNKRQRQYRKNKNNLSEGESDTC